MSHRADDPYYAKMVDTIKFITRGYRVRLVLVGGGTAKDPAQNTTMNVPVDYVKRISNIAGALWASSNAVRVDAPSYTFLESFIAMMQADVLVGSGSSLPTSPRCCLPPLFSSITSPSTDFTTVQS